MIKTTYLPEDAKLWARGRNGIFTPTNMEVFGGKEELTLTLNSKRSGKNSPIMFAGTPATIEIMARAMLKACEEVKGGKQKA